MEEKEEKEKGKSYCFCSLPSLLSLPCSLPYFFSRGEIQKENEKLRDKLSQPFCIFYNFRFWWYYPSCYYPNISYHNHRITIQASPRPAALPQNATIHAIRQSPHVPGILRVSLHFARLLGRWRVSRILQRSLAFCEGCPGVAFCKIRCILRGVAFCEKSGILLRCISASEKCCMCATSHSLAFCKALNCNELRLAWTLQRCLTSVRTWWHSVTTCYRRFIKRRFSNELRNRLSRFHVHRDRNVGWHAQTDYR